MQKMSGGVAGRTKRRFQHHLGQGPALQVLLMSTAALLSGCGSKDSPSAAATGLKAIGEPSALGTSRTALTTNTVLTVIGDTFVRQGVPNENEGSNDELSVQTSSIHRTLLFFDTPAIQAAVGSETLSSARIDLFIAVNGGGWGPGRALSIHSLRQASSESAATWSCALDSNTLNRQANCSGGGTWNMLGAASELPFVPTATSTTTITNGRRGVVSFDVTADVIAIMAGTLPGHGWLIKKMDEVAGGAVRFSSREQGTAPRLTLTLDSPDLCTPTAIADTTCDGVDDDCDGSADEDVLQVETTCGTGACASAGMLTCVEAQMQDSCVAGTPAALDGICDLIDEDCDGTVDEDYTPVVSTCGVGACVAHGSTSCVLGAVIESCEPGEPGGADANCDGADDDCDGSVDEEYVVLATACGVGACRQGGRTSCLGGVVLDDCQPSPPAALDASCNGVDDDCDGTADEEFAPTCAGPSRVTCVSGSLLSSSCADQNPCNGDESCAGAATCVAGTPPSLDDGDPCTVGACLPANGVIHTLVAAGTNCGAYRECDATGQCVSLVPPDPSEVAPGLPAGTVSLLDRVRFMYEGNAPSQTGVAPGVISNRTVAVLRGRVLDASGQPLPQVTVSVHGHPELGKTLSRIDGQYDLVVNGGGPLTVSFQRGDVIEAQRTVQTPWQDYESLDDVALFGHDAAVTHAAFPNVTPVVHLGSPAEDARGARRARLFVPTGTSVVLTLPNGTQSAASQLSLRTSELGVGLSGSVGLSALLPETASPVYTVELSADEAVSAQASDVKLSKAASLYVDNFIQLPVGMTLPLGTYDRAKATWFGAQDGRVLAFLGANQGHGELDIDGSGTPATTAALMALGIGIEERTALVGLYAAGDTFIRLPVNRLAPFGVGLPFRSGEGTGSTPPSAPGQLAPLDDATLPGAPLVNGVLSQSLPLVGTPFTLTYRSDRVVGDKRGQKLAVQALGNDVDGGVVGATVDVRIAGQRHLFEVPALPAAGIDFTWDGTDAAGRPLHGWQRASIRLGVLSDKRYLEPSDPSAFGHTAFGAPVVGQAPDSFVRWSSYDRLLYSFDSRQTDIGAWSIDQHHQYDPKSRVVYKGDGSSFATRTNSTIIDRFAGVPQTIAVGQHSGDGGPALLARMDSPRSVAVGPDGALYVGTRRGVRRVDPDTSILTTVAGGPSCNSLLVDGLATDMCIDARSIDFARDGSLVIGDNPAVITRPDRLRRLDLATGQIRHVAGVTPTAGCSNMGDGGPARNAALCDLTAHATAPDGSIYLLDRGSSTNPLAVRKISTDGIIDTVAHADWGTSDDGAALAAGPDGSIYIAQTRSVLRMWPTGEIEHFAGDLTANGNDGEGSAAVVARFGNNGPSSVFVGADGRVLIGDTGNSQIRMVDQAGIIRRIAGGVSNDINSSGNGGSPLAAGLGTRPVRTALSPDGAMFLTSQREHVVRVVRPSTMGDFAGEALVRSPNGTELYRFAANGRHLDTTDVSSGTRLYSFGYDSAQRLVSATDAAEQTTVIERDPEGNPVRIVAPSGEETLLDTNGSGYISTFIAPSGDETDLSYDANGLLTGMVDASGTQHFYEYDVDGRWLAP